jgi:hypothetical protein
MRCTREKLCVRVADIRRARRRARTSSPVAHASSQIAAECDVPGGGVMTSASGLYIRADGSRQSTELPTVGVGSNGRIDLGGS